MSGAELVSGEGWVSDDSSFYGDEEEQDRQLSLGVEFNPSHLWSAQESNLNTIRARTRSSTMSVTTTKLPEREMSVNSQASNKPPDFLLEHRAMEEARLARLGKRVHEPSPEPVLSNPGQGSPSCWQLGETADDFVRRLPPLTTSILDCGPWIWVHNPCRDPHDGCTSHRVQEFTSHGQDVLAQSLQSRQQIKAKGAHGSVAVVNRALNEEGKALQQRITDLAVEFGIMSGKWMLFPSPVEVTHVWRKVVSGVISSRLGPTAKVATDEGAPGDRLICIYTKDFRDEEDVLRVLSEMKVVDLLPSGRGIYYKSDAYTYLNLYKETAMEYGLQASLYSSLKMMAAAKVAKMEAKGGKKQKTLNSYF